MKKYTLSLADSLTHRPEHPERTAKRSRASGFDFDVTFQVWPNRASMLKTIELQQRGEPRADHWRPVQP